MLLGLNFVLLYMNYLLLQLELSGAVEVSVNLKTVIERSNYCNFHYLFIFFFLKEKGKSCRNSDYMSV